jgi:hypothetical protein
MHKLFVSSLAIVLGLALAACDEDGGNWDYDGTIDIGVETPTDTITEPTTDIGVETVPDGTGDCAHTLGTFTPTEVLAGDIGEGWWTVRAPLSGSFSSPLSMLDIEVNTTGGGPSGPTTVNITSFSGIGSCSTCIIIVEGCVTDLSDCSGYWMAEQATLDITSLSVSVGSPFEATLSGVIMTAWDPGGDVAVPGDSYCVDVWNISTTFTDPATW